MQFDEIILPGQQAAAPANAKPSSPGNPGGFDEVQTPAFTIAPGQSGGLNAQWPANYNPTEAEVNQATAALKAQAGAPAAPNGSPDGFDEIVPPVHKGEKARVTFYTRFDDGPKYFAGQTAAAGPDGKLRAREGVTIAVDPKVIPYGSKVYIPALKDLSANQDGIFIAHDTGADVRKRTASGGQLPVIDVFAEGPDQQTAQARSKALANAIGTNGLEFQILDVGKPADAPMTFKEFAMEAKEKKERSVSQAIDAGMSAAGSAVVELAKTVRKGAGEMVAEPSRIPASIIEGAARGTYDLLDLGRKVAANFTPGSTKDPVYNDYQDYLVNWSFQKQRAVGSDGGGNLAPQLVGQPLPAASEAASMVLDPSVIVPGGLAASKLGGAGMRAAAKMVAPIAAGVETAGRGVGNAVVRAGKAAEAGIVAATGASPEMIRGAAGVVGAGSLLTPAAAVTATGAGVVAGAKATEKAGQVLGAVAEKVLEAPSQWGVLERIARDQAKPGWLRKGAQAAARSQLVTMTGKAGMTAVKGGVQGGIVGGVLAAATGGDAEEIGAAIGSGVAMGAGAALVGRALTRSERVRASQDADVARFISEQAKHGADIERIARLSREDLTQAATIQQLVKADTDVVFLDKAEFLKPENAGGKTAAGVFISQGAANSRPRILVNMDAQLPAGRTLVHEMWHALAIHPAIDKTASRLAVDRLYGTSLDAMAREYAAHLLSRELGRKPTADEISGKVLDLTNDSIARGDLDGKDWLRDEIFAEQAVAEIRGGGLDLNALRRGSVRGSDPSPLREGLLAVKAGMLARLGVELDQAGRPTQPMHQIFQENPIMRDKGMRELLAKYLRDRDQWLDGLSKVQDAKGAALLAVPGKLNELAKSPAVEWRVTPEGRQLATLPDGSRFANAHVIVAENDFSVQLADGTVLPKDPAVIAKTEKSRVEQLKNLFTGALLPRGSTEFGRRLGAGGRTNVGGPKLPPQWDLFSHFSQETRAMARAIENSNGETFGMWYHQIGSAGPDGSWKQAVKQGLGNVTVTQREVSFLNWQLSKAGNLLAAVLDVGAARKRSIEWYQQGKLERWGNNIDAFASDVRKYLDNHAKGLPGENAIGIDKRNLINAFFGIGTAVNKAANPLSVEHKGTSLIKTFRLDRMNNAQPTGRKGWAFDYDKVNQNFSPDVEK